MENKAVEICNLGVEEYKNGNIQKALDLFDEAEKLNPKCLEAILNKSSLFLKEKNYDRALEEAEKALKINARSYKVLSAEAEVLFAIQEYNKAEKYADLALKHSLREVRPMMIKANISSAINKKAEAEKYYNLILKKEPENIEAIRNMRSLVLSANRYSDAEKYAQKAIEITNDTDDKIAYIYILDNINKQDAFEYCKEHEKELINSQYFCLLYAKLSEYLNNFKKAIELYKKIDSEEAKIKIEILSNVNNIKKLLEFTDKYPNNTDIYKYAFKKAIELKNIKKIDKITDKFISSEIIKKDKSISTYFGVLLLTYRFFESAKKIFEHEELKEIEQSIFSQSMIYYLHEKDYIKAEKRIKDAIKLNPTNVTYIGFLLIFLYKSDQLQELSEQIKNLSEEEKMQIIENMISICENNLALKILNSIETENEIVKKMKEQCLENTKEG